jgi:tetratricopeptide (TPR) repeat protein
MRERQLDRRPGAISFVLLAAILIACYPGSSSAQTVNELRSAGAQALADDDYYGAIEAFGAALQINARDRQSVVGIAESYYWLGEYDQAETLGAHALALSRRDPEILTLNGRIAIGLGNLDAAREFFDRVRTIEPNNVQAEIGLAELALAEGKNLDATLALERALRIHPDHEKALLSLVLIYEQLGNYETAEDYLELALEAHGNASETHILAAEYAIRRGNNDGAAAHARTAQALDANNEPAARIRAIVALLEGRYLEAVTTAEELLGRDRVDARTWFLRGQALIGAERLEEAMDSFRTALRYEPDNEIVRLVAENIAIREYALDAPIRAEFAAYVTERAARFTGGYLYAKALSSYQRALRLTPFDVSIRLAYAELRRTLGHTATYLQELAVITESGEGSPDLDRRISVYENILSESVSARWGIDQFTLSKSEVSLGVYLSSEATPLSYPLAEQALLETIARNLQSLDRLDVRMETQPKDFPAAFALARSEDVDFFILLRLADSPRSFAAQATVHVGRTGVSVATISASRVGPNRVSDTLDALSRRVDALFPMQTNVVRRRGNQVVVDAGARDGIEDGMVLTVLAPEAMIIEPGALGYTYDAASVLGTITITDRDDLISEGTISVDGLVDAIAVGDVAVLQDEEAVAPRNSAVLYPLLYDRVRALR